MTKTLLPPAASLFIDKTIESAFPKMNAPTRCFARTPVYPWQVNEAGFIKAGHVLMLIDILASESAFKYVRNSTARVVTASVDRTDFCAPIRAWEMITMAAYVTQVWNSSLESQVVIRAENFITGESRDVAVSHLVFVAIDPSTRTTVKIPAYTPPSALEQQLAQSADLRKLNRKEEGKTAPFIPIDDNEDKPVLFDRVMTPMDANGMGNVFGGVILDILDSAGSKASQRQALGQPVVGVRLDRMSFLEPGYIGERIEARAIVTKTWQTSMEVQVEVTAINPHTGDTREIAKAYLVYVGLGSDDKAAPVPPWNPKTEKQKLRAEAADKRRQIRKEEEHHSAQMDLSEKSHEDAVFSSFQPNTTP